jgi:hypothetical protein
LSVVTKGSRRLPSPAALASREWRDVSDSAMIGDVAEGTPVLLILFKNLHEVFEEGQSR